ncbi:hypothetical protein Tel_12655 [Candidatus Tenderia electrophaga]|jgi:hypothetical protein|uniref:Uncharacterized protein n=1 Tax=Candidatus Tenderia electrophaga TaxID=1748243 RepID=A0A0S2TFI8_9GAMM|nr:hypothetical protein Tel_12655 [Candidatus Tenderia electrophaga]
MSEAGTAKPSNTPASFAIKDCALVALATGKKVTLLREFRRELQDIDAASIYHHFWGGLLQPRFEEREYNNDFAAWMQHGIHDAALAERLAVLDPTRATDLEALRCEVLEQIDIRLEEVEYLSWSRASQPFVFICSQIVVFDTGRRLQRPQELAKIVSQLSTSSIFYHFIDARRRTEHGHDDFSDWLTLFGEQYGPLKQALQAVDPYFGSLSELRRQLISLLQSHFPEVHA